MDVASEPLAPYHERVLRAVKRIVALVGVMAALYGALVALAFFGQRRLLFPAPKVGDEPRMDDATLTRVTAPSGRTVYALHVPPKKLGAVTVVHFHGNAEELSAITPLAWAFRRAGLGFFAVEYPGYGLARDYAPSEEALYADAEAALWHLHNGLGVPTESVVLQGQSLGSGVAVEMAKRGHGARLVLISPYTSIPDMAAATLPILPARWLVKDRFDNLQKAPSLTLPVLIVHGSADEVIPFSMGERLSKAFPTATLYAAKGAHHNDLFVRDGRIIVDRIVEFSTADFTGR
jgi:alpha-beta hydrolase superfamily lysophospholipase